MARSSFKSRTGWSGSGSDNTESESESFDLDQKRKCDPDCQSIDSLDEEHVFVSNYGRCLRRTPARKSAAAAAALCSGDHSQPRTGSSPFIDYIDISDSTSPEESLSSSPELLLLSQKSKSEKHEEEDNKEDREENKEDDDDISSDQHGSEKSSRTSSPIRWMPPPEHWTLVPGCLLDQIVVTDVITSDSKITVKECRTKHGFFRSFPPKMKRIKQEK